MTIFPKYKSKPKYHTRIKHFALAATMLISACNNNSTPAPVVTLSTKVATPENLTEITTSTYTVEAGDTLFSVAFYSGNDYRDLAETNNISPPYVIKIGQVLDLKKAQIISSDLNIVNNSLQTSVENSTTKIIKQVKTRPVAITASKPKPVQNSNKKLIDPKQEQEYGRKNGLAHHKHQANENNKTVAWIWPASGNHKIATVGSDGSTRGLDIKGRMGAKIVAAASGKVVYAGNALKGYGNLVIIKHNEEYLSAYAHNQAILVSEQMYVKQGQTIATMGNSGASQVMLHFEIRKKGQSIDPFVYLPTQ